MLNQNLAHSLTFTKKYIPFIDKPSTSDAVVTFHVAEEISKTILNLLKVFVNTHCSFNKNVTIYIFTNHPNLIKNFIDNDKLITIYVPETKKGIMLERGILIYHVIENFSNYKRLYIFDTDVLPVNDYSKLKKFNNGYDIGFTYNNEWKKQNKFPFNGGFFLINYTNKKNIEKFMSTYIDVWDFVLKNQNKIYQKKIINHDPENYSRKNLADWYGDQYVYLFLLKKNIDSKIKVYADWKDNEINYRVFDEYMFNFSSAELKKQDVQFNVSDYFKRKIFPKRFFIHLKGSIKDKFIEKIAKILNVPI